MDHVDPSLAERQRMLKKCRLADALNDQLAHRPGPLELIQKNILHADETIERAVKGKQDAPTQLQDVVCGHPGNWVFDVVCPVVSSQTA